MSTCSCSLVFFHSAICVAIYLFVFGFVGYWSLYPYHGIPINLYDDILLCHGWTWWEHGVLPMEHSLAFLDNELVSRVIPPCGPCDHCEPCYLVRGLAIFCLDPNCSSTQLFDFMITLFTVH